LSNIVWDQSISLPGSIKSLLKMALHSQSSAVLYCTLPTESLTDCEEHIHSRLHGILVSAIMAKYKATHGLSVLSTLYLDSCRFCTVYQL